MAEAGTAMAAASRTFLSAATTGRLTDAGMTNLKWIALAAMTLDHLNKYGLQGVLPFAFELGRVALPTFAIVLGSNLARPQALAQGIYARTARRLMIVALIAQIPFFAVGGTIVWAWPLNVLFTLWVGCQIVWALDRGGRFARAGAAMLFVLGGALVEFWWPALALVVSAWLWGRGKPAGAVCAAIFGFAGLQFINGTAWALVSIPLVAAIGSLPLATPRCSRFFYVFYPAHLLALWALQGIRS